jgi:SAM-dependent methyltransferase
MENIKYQDENIKEVKTSDVSLPIKKVYPDSELIHFPYVTREHSDFNEWEINREVSEKFAEYIKNISVKTILNLNCENGWFTNLIAKNNYAKVLGVDNEIKGLKQAQRVFIKDNLIFKKEDVFNNFNQKFDVIVLNNSLNYHKDIPLLITKLKSLLNEHGEIHILEYPTGKVIDSLKVFKLLHEPKSFLKRILGKKSLPLAWYYYHS